MLVGPIASLRGTVHRREHDRPRVGRKEKRSDPGSASAVTSLIQKHEGEGSRRQTEGRRCPVWEAAAKKQVAVVDQRRKKHPEMAESKIGP